MENFYVNLRGEANASPSRHAEARIARSQFAKACVYFVYCASVDHPLRTSLWLFLIAAGCALTLSACAASSNQSPPPGAAVVEAPDYNKQGGTWTYRVVHKMFSGTSRSDIDYGDYEVRIRNGKYTRRRSDTDRRPLPSRTWLYSMLPTSTLLESKQQYFNFPLWVGKDWKGWTFLGRWQDSHQTVTGMETVTTPAGTFETYRIERRFVMFVDIRNLYDTEIYYYSSQTRSVVKYEYKREMKDLVGDVAYGLQESASVELLSYKPEPESSTVKKVSAY
ncbi:MAG TPA: hypothetical protein VGH16_08905 [Candidatus Binatia bacterium]|jgi:hypothetical protein